MIILQNFQHFIKLLKALSRSSQRFIITTFIALQKKKPCCSEQQNLFWTIFYSSVLLYFKENMTVPETFNNLGVFKA